MKKLLTILSLLLLASCGAEPIAGNTPSLQDRLRNPLFAERYWSEMAEHMADFVRRNDTLAKDPEKGPIIEAERVRALERVTEARERKDEGISGGMLPVEEDIIGQVLLRESTLYTSSDFLAYPNPSVRVYLSTAIDPRDVNFPDTTSVDLGSLQSPYGAQEYVVPEEKLRDDFASVVFYDTRLDRILGFAQLSK